MSDYNKKKHQICLVSDQLASGGAERCAASLSCFLEANNCSVYHVIVVDKVEYDYSGSLLNLGLVYHNVFPFINRFYRFWILNQFFKKNKFDYIIDFRMKNKQVQEFVIAKFIYNSPLIVSIRSFNTNWYFPKNNFLARKIYSHCYKIITVSNKIKQKIESDFNYSNVETIYNAVNFEYIQTQSMQHINVNFQYILAIGRMDDDVKQFDKLISSYKSTSLRHHGIKLLIIGDGVKKEKLILHAKSLSLLDDVVFLGKINNPFPYYKNAFFTVLSSKYEGFPNVLIESLACETPVVSFDCYSGPNEIISQNINGLLVENQNFYLLSKAMDTLFIDEKLYKNCKDNAKKSVLKFDLENIGKHWLNMMNIDTN